MRTELRVLGPGAAVGERSCRGSLERGHDVSSRGEVEGVDAGLRDEHDERRVDTDVERDAREGLARFDTRDASLESVARAGVRFGEAVGGVERDGVGADHDPDRVGVRGDDGADGPGRRLDGSEFAVTIGYRSPQNRFLGLRDAGELDFEALEVGEEVAGSVREGTSPATGAAALALDQRAEGVLEFDHAALRARVRPPERARGGVERGVVVDRLKQRRVAGGERHARAVEPRVEVGLVAHTPPSPEPSKTLITGLTNFDVSMREQRPSWSRRVFLANAVAVGGAVAGCSNVAGTISDTTGGSRAGSGTATTASGRAADETNASGSGPVSILSAGSLELAFENGLSKAVGTELQVESHGSSTVARMVSEGQRDPDIVTLADTALFDGPLHPSWYATFASNAVVIAYNENTEAGKGLGNAGAKNWYAYLLDNDVSLGRTDPTQDPLGYRALLMLELASRYYDDATNLRKTVPNQNQIYPETGLISQFESGNVDAAIAYRNMAVERDYDYIDLPDQIDLSNPKYEDDWYSTVSYTSPSGKETEGGLISYGSTIRNVNQTTRSVFEAQTTGEYLEEYGFKIPSGYPNYHGTPPSALTN